MGRVRFYHDEVYLAYRKKTKQNMVKAMKHTVNACKELVGKTGAQPSRPGEAPRKVTGELQRSIHSKVEEDQQEVRGYLYSTSPYALRMEFGFYGTDSMGRTYNQAPRPFLRKTVDQERMNIKRIVLSGR